MLNVHMRYAKAVHADASEFHPLLDRNDLTLDVSSMIPWSRWITPVNETRRYDTWFYLNILPDKIDISAVADDLEITQCTWMTPGEALYKYSEGEIQLPPPTLYILRELQQYPQLTDLTAFALHRNKSNTIQTLLPTVYVEEEKTAEASGKTTVKKKAVIALPGDEAHRSEFQQQSVTKLDGLTSTNNTKLSPVVGMHRIYGVRHQKGQGQHWTVHYTVQPQSRL
jgi:hypothetical protein